MSTMPVGATGWVDRKQDGSFNAQPRGAMTRTDARRLGEWLLEQTKPDEDDSHVAGPER
jgi:hypothetical protein